MVNKIKAVFCLILFFQINLAQADEIDKFFTNDRYLVAVASRMHKFAIGQISLKCYMMTEKLEPELNSYTEPTELRNEKYYDIAQKYTEAYFNEVEKKLGEQESNKIAMEFRNTTVQGATLWFNKINDGTARTCSSILESVQKGDFDIDKNEQLVISINNLSKDLKIYTDN